MSMESITFSVGETAYKQPLKLTWAKDTAGRWTWHLRQCPADQRDNYQLICGISDDTLLAMAAVVQQRRKLTA